MIRHARIVALLASSAMAMAVSATTVEAVGATDGSFVGTCAAAAALPCSVSAGQIYNGTLIDPSGNDTEDVVEAVLAEAVGPAADVASVTRGLTRSSGEFRFTPDDVTSGQKFEWSYTGDATNLAYVTIKAAKGFAVFGIAGQRSGTIDVSGLLGGHEISHLSVWAANVSQAEPVKATKLHGKSFFGNMRLSKITNGTVPCVHSDTAEPAECRFTRKSGEWLESKKGAFAVAGQAMTLDGQPGGEYVTAAKIGAEGAVPCLESRGNDAAGTPYGTELAHDCVIETANAGYNVTGEPLRNFATREVCTTTALHPDSAQRTRDYWSGSYHIYCYTGRGAALNDRYGTERDEFGRYYPDTKYCHVIWSSGHEYIAAKRPNTRSYPTPEINPLTPIVWRIYHPQVSIAN